MNALLINDRECVTVKVSIRKRGDILDKGNKNNWLSVADVNEKIGVPVETIRRYIRSHGVHLRVKKTHKRYLIHDDSLTMFEQIRRLYADGKNVEEVEQALTNKGFPMTVKVQLDNETNDSMTVNVADELLELKQMLTEQQKVNEQQIAFNKQLLQELEQQKQILKDSFEKQDHKLIQSLRQGLEVRKQIAIGEEQARERKAKKGLFARLFGK